MDENKTFDVACPIALPTTREAPFDPPPDLAGIRETSNGICRLRYPDGQLGWLVTSYGIARQLLLDARFSVRPSRRGALDDLEESAAAVQAVEGLSEVGEGVLISLDPPAHTTLRRLQAGFFTSDHVTKFQDEIERIVSERIDAIRKAGPPTDLVEAFALPVASLTLCHVLGVPPSDRSLLERVVVTETDPGSSIAQRVAATREFLEYVRAVLDRKRAVPSDDLLSTLVSRDELTDDQLAGVATQLFAAGFDTTANQIALSIFLLLANHDRWNTVQKDFSLLDSAIEELLRYTSIVQIGTFMRTATEDVELDGKTIRAGEGVTVSLSAANRDPGKFSDPDNFDIKRSARGHLAFGHGRHICLGQHLARLEMKCALSGLIRGLPNLRLATSVDDIPLRHEEDFLHGVRMLPVAW